MKAKLEVRLADKLLFKHTLNDLTYEQKLRQGLLGLVSTSTNVNIVVAIGRDPLIILSESDTKKSS